MHFSLKLYKSAARDMLRSDVAVSPDVITFARILSVSHPTNANAIRDTQSSPLSDAYQRVLSVPMVIV